MKGRNFRSDEIGYLAEETSKQNIQSGVLFLLTAYSEMYEKKKSELKKIMLSKG